jgi:hypothetical protein
LLLPFALLCACEPGSEPKKPSGGGDAAAAETAAKKEPPLAETGVPVIAKDYDNLGREVAAQEKALAETGEVNARLVRIQMQLCENLIIAAQLSVKNQTKAETETRYALLRQKQGKHREAVAVHLAEVKKMEDMLAEPSTIPAGFTATEVEDKIKDERAAAAESRRALDAVTDEMVEVHKLLGLEEIPPQRESQASRILEDLRRLKKRIDVLAAAIE